MKILFERWLKIRYTLYSPLYDLIGGLFMSQRKRSIEMAEIIPQDKVLIIGAGTGLDLKYMKDSESITAIDISEGMLSKLKKRAQKNNFAVKFQIMDARNLVFADLTFDVILLHMIIAVIPEYQKAIQEAERVLKPGGRVMIFDKLLPDNQKKSLFRKLINPLAILIASDLNRTSSDILQHTKLEKIKDEPAGWGGLLRILKLVKP